MEYKTFVTEYKLVEDRTVTGLASITGNLDAYTDIIHHGAFKKTIAERSGRVRHLWQHDYMQPPVAAIKDMQEIPKGKLPSAIRDAFPNADGGLEVTREYLDTPRGNEVLQGIKSGAINEMSIGYDPVKYDFEEQALDGEKLLVRNLREVRLWDTSDVNWGANEATVASKAAVPFKDTGMADEGMAWSGPTLGDFTGDNWSDVSSSDRTRIGGHFAWSANLPPESYGDLKLPHHQAAKTGIGPAVWRGVAGAMARLLQSGTQIPDGDRRAVYNHLAKHYKQFDKPVPDFKTVEFAWMVAELRSQPDALTLGLYAPSPERLQDALDVLTKMLTAAEPPDPQEAAALTERVLRNIAVYEHDPIYLSVR
jgi:HK97 family phage prohead protease